MIILANHWRRNGGGGRGGGTRKKGGPAPYLPPPPLFMVHLSLPCPQYFNLSAAIPYVSEVTSGFLKMKNFPHVSIGKYANRKTNDFSITVDCTCIRAEPQVKLLGIYVDSRLTFSYQISQICIPATRQLNALKKILDTYTKLLLIKSSIMCHFNYWQTVWNSCGKAIND